MQLSNYIEFSITEIVKGIVNAQKNNQGAVINPAISDHKSKSECTISNGKYVRKERINFEIGVTVAESKDKGGQAELGVFGLKVGGNLGKNTATEAENKLKFGIDVGFPPQLRSTD